MAIIDLEYVRRRGNQDSIANAHPTDVAASVVALGDRYEASGEVNFDELLNIGIMLSARGHASSDETIIGWFEQRPTATRLDISSALLFGLWHRLSGDNPVALKHVARLVAARPLTRLSPDAEYSYALALSRVLDDPGASREAVRMARDALQASVARGTGLHMTDAMLAGLVRDSLHNAQTPTDPAPLAEVVAYDRQEQGRHHLAIEHTPTAAEVVRVLTLLVTGRMLLVEYRILAPRVTDEKARVLIFHAVLVNLCRGVYRNYVDEVRYVNLTTRTELVARYAPFE